MADEHQTVKKYRRYYMKNSIVPFEEDSTHEFKGHRCISKEEIPLGAVQNGSNRPSRQPVSKAINGFLNTGNGGTVYLGILDSGQVKGLSLTIYNQDHFQATLDDLMSRYSPVVPSHRYKVRFVTVVSENSTDDEIAQQSTYNAKESVESESRLRPHKGVLSPEYVIEVVVHPWDPTDPRNQKLVPGPLKLCPFHADESGTVYHRRQASLISYTAEDIFRLSRKEASHHWQNQLKVLREERSNLRKELFKNISA